ncbi:MAG: cytochrome c [gamma proteobacterium symbiont of Lucinoma myriamae]|nr:cytochrome c [gamma proteobacterium symbiont of Lucinoma myriamae]
MKHSFLVVVFCCSIFYSFTAFSQDDADDVIKYRQNMMKTISMHYKSLKLLSAGRITQPDQWLPQAQGLNNMAKMTTTAFPEESDFGETDAKESIWENKPDFNKKAEALLKFSGKLVSVIEQGKQQQAAELLREISQSCKNCHKKYREK